MEKGGPPPGLAVIRKRERPAILQFSTLYQINDLSKGLSVNGTHLRCIALSSLEELLL